MKTISTIKTEGKDVVAELTVGMLKLRALTSNDYSDEFLNRWMDPRARVAARPVVPEYGLRAPGG